MQAQADRMQPAPPLCAALGMPHMRAHAPLVPVPLLTAMPPLTHRGTPACLEAGHRAGRRRVSPACALRTRPGWAWPPCAPRPRQGARRAQRARVGA